jgi:hypothetical protein
MRIEFTFGMVGISVRYSDMMKKKALYKELLLACCNCQGDRTLSRQSWAILLTNLLIYGFFGSLSIHAVAPKGIVWQVPVQESTNYRASIEALLQVYEASSEKTLTPGSKQKVGLKVNTRSGTGLSTPRALLLALIEALERRGFERSGILIIDAESHDLRAAGILPSRAIKELSFAGCPVLALDSENYFDAQWYYDSPLPPAFRALGQGASNALAEEDATRKSFLPKPLLFEVDFWINLPVGCDDPALGIDGALSNMTLWNVSNSYRFLVNQATASAAVAEIAAIPELVDGAWLHIMPMNYYQFIGGPSFNSLYTHSKPFIRMSADPVALDRLLYEDLNERRRLAGFPEITPMPQQLSFAASLGLGVYEIGAIDLRLMPLPEVE